MTTLVTGAGGGIGAAVVRRLARAGETVLAHDVRPVAPAPGVVPLSGDLLDDGAVAALRDAVGEHGPLDAAIAAHGVDGSGSVEVLEPALVARLLGINGTSVAKLYDAVAASLADGGGAFVAIASQAGLRPEPDNAAYCAAKAAVVGWVRRHAPVAARSSIALRALCPGCTDTPLLRAAHERFAAAQGLDVEALLQRRRDGIPIRRFGDVAEVAAAATYLAEKTRPRPTVLAVTGGEVIA